MGAVASIVTAPVRVVEDVVETAADVVETVVARSRYDVMAEML